MTPRWPIGAALGVGTTTLVVLNTTLLPPLLTSAPAPVPVMDTPTPILVAALSANPTTTSRPAAPATTSRPANPTTTPEPTNPTTTSRPTTKTTTPELATQTTTPKLATQTTTPRPTNPTTTTRPANPTTTPKPALELRFDLDSAAITGRHYTRLVALAADLRQTGDPIHVECSTDPFGADWFNERLSQSRCDAVARLLLNEGVARDRITTHSLGAIREASDHPTNPTHAPARRVARLWRR